MIVINVEVKSVEAAELSICTTKLTKVCEISKVVCLQEKAIVNPKVMIIKDLNCVLNSCLNFFEL